MSSTDIYQPYTYLIGWSEHDLWYYGVRFAKGCNPADLWVRYFTSSKIVAKCRHKYGEPDIVSVRRTFKCMTEAIEWEAKVLRRLNVVKQRKWLNRSLSRQNHDKIDRLERDVSTFQTYSFRFDRSVKMRERYASTSESLAYRQTDAYKRNMSDRTKTSYEINTKQPNVTGQRPVTIDGHTFDSVQSASCAYGISITGVIRRIQNPRWDTWNYATPEPSTGFNRRSVSVNGMVYPSVSDAARTFNISVKAAYNRLNKDTWPDWTYL